jgi:hypothetical protein
MIKASKKLITRGVVESKATTDPGTEWQKLGGAKSFWKARITGEDDAEELLGIEIFACENPELIENGGERLLCLVNDKDGAASG